MRFRGVCGKKNQSFCVFASHLFEGAPCVMAPWLHQCGRILAGRLPHLCREPYQRQGSACPRGRALAPLHERPLSGRHGRPYSSGPNFFKALCDGEKLAGMAAIGHTTSPICPPGADACAREAQCPGCRTREGAGTGSAPRMQ